MLRNYDTLRSPRYAAVEERRALVRKVRDQNRGVGRNPALCFYFGQSRYLESTCRPGSGRGLHYRVSAAPIHH